MNGQRINRSIIRSSFVEISRMYESQKVLQKNVVFLICDNTARGNIVVLLSPST